MEEIMSIIAPALVYFLGWIPGKETLQVIVIRDGETLEFSHGYNHDEGYGWDAVTYEYDARTGIVARSSTSFTTSCDGPLTRYYDDECHVSALYERDVVTQWSPTLVFGESFETELPGEHVSDDHKLFDEMTCPEWEKVSASQCDVFAEAMGY